MADSAPVPAAEDNYFDQYSQPSQAPAPAAPPARSDATPVEVISPSEAKKRKDSGGYLANGQSAPEAAVVDTQQPGPSVPGQPSGQSQVAAADDDYFDRQYGKPAELPAPPAGKPPKPESHLTSSFFKGAVGQSNRLLQLMALAGYALRPTEEGMRASAAEGGQDMPAQEPGFDQEAGDSYFKNVVDPIVQNQQRFDLDPNASFSEKLSHGVGSTLMMIDQAIATGGEGAAATPAATVVGRAAVGASTMTAPAAAAAVDTGRRVLEATGDKKAAAVAGATSYLTSVASGAVPFGVGKSLLARIPSAAATGAAVGEVNRDVNNAVLPDSMKQPFSLEQSAIDALIGAPFGMMGGHNGEQIPRTPDVPAATEKPTTIMEHAQSVAAAEVAAKGGDLLDQTVAASHVNSVLSAHHDAAAYEGHLEVQQQQAEQLRLETEQEEAQRNQTAAFEAAEEAKKSNATPLSDAFAEVEQNTEEGRAQDYSKALNQKGDQEIATAQDAEKGGAGFEQPKLLDGLAPEQLQAFKTLAERRTAEMAGEPLPDESPESKFTPYVEPKKAEAAPEAVDKTVATPAEVAPPAKPPETLQERRAGNGMQAPELPAAEREAPTAAVQAPDLRGARTESERPIRDERLTGEDAAVQDRFASLIERDPEAAKKAYAELPDSVGGRYLGGDISRKLSEDYQRDPLNSSKGTQMPSQWLLDQMYRDRIAKEDGKPVLFTGGGTGSGKTQGALTAAKSGDLDAYNSIYDSTFSHGDSIAARIKAARDAGHPVEVAYTYRDPVAAFGMNGALGRAMKMGRTVDAESHINTHTNGVRTVQKIAKKFAGDPQVQVSVVHNTEALHGEDPWVGTADSLPRNPSAILRRQLQGVLDREHQSGNISDDVYRKAAGREPPAAETPTSENAQGHLERAEAWRRGEEPSSLADRREQNQRRAERQFVAGQKGKDQPRFADNNASGESPASLEAIRRVRDEAAQGKTRHLIDPDGNSMPLTGVDAVDAKAPKGHIIAQANGEGGHTVLDRGGLSQLHANGLLNRAREKGLAEPIAARDTEPRSAEEADAQRAAPITKSEAERTLKPVLDKMGENVQLHADHTTLPQGIQQLMRDNNHPTPLGVYDPATDQVHIVAGNHESHDELVRTAVHEIVGHQGLRHLLGDDYAEKMASIYQTVKGGSWAKDYIAQHGLDARNLRHQRLVADEYAAHLAEHDVGHPEQENPGLLRRAIDAVRAGLRKVGLVRDWTDNDIRQLLRQSANNLASENAGIRESAQAKGDGPRFADKEDSVPFDPEHPIAQAHKFGKTMEGQANYNPGYLKSRLDWAKDKIGETTDARLAFIGLRNLPDFMDQKVMPSLRQFIRTHDQMDGRRGDLMNKAADLARDWSKYISKDKQRGGALGELMHASTLGGVDPSKPFEARYSDAEKTADATKAAHEDMRKDLHARLKEVFNKQLDDKGRELFNTVRDRYAQNRMEVFKALEARIMDSGADNNTKKMIMAEMRQKLESGKVRGPYFPLARFGDHWASAKDAEGNTVSFSRFESASQKKAWIGEMKEKGFATDGGQRMDDKSLMERIDPKFVQKVTEMAKAVDPGLADEVWQTYLRAMPEMSMRKHFIHRVGRLGYSMDAMRAFAYNSFHGAHQLARLEYGNRLDSTLDNIKTEARAAEAADPTSKNAQWAPALAREMSRRYDWIKNPRSSPLASALTKFGFGWYLGAAPATAFRIFSQNPMLAQPMLAKFHGQLGATRELSRASAQWARARGSLGDTLRGDERRAFDTADQMGMFSSTATQSLASGGAGEPMFTGTYYHVQKAMGYLFNAMEHHNRQTTYLAAYRLGRTQGMSHDAAVNHAGDLTWDSHFDYTNANRPRVLQNDAAKVALLFKQYSWGVSYRLAREARDMFNSELTPEQNGMARKAFAGLLTRGMMFAGVTGLPLAWVATSVINAVMGDKDRPFDAEAAAHASLEQHLGKTAADAVMTGPMGAITGASLSNGASYNDLWYRPPSRDEKPAEQWSDLTGQLLGAIPAIGTNAATGIQMMHDGQVERGFEHFVPPEAAALMKAYRYSQEGVTNLRGEQVLSRDELNNKDLFLQAIGFSPQKVADAYRVNTALKNVSAAIQDRREQIMNHLQVASGMGDSDEIDKAMAEVEHFNSVNPGVAIAGKSIITSMRDRFKQSAEAINGVRLPPGLNDLRDTYGPATEPQP